MPFVYAFTSILILAGMFIFASIRIKTLDVSERTKRFSIGMNILLLFVPLLAVTVFGVLFLFVLKGRFYERLSHAVLVFALWLYAARFYWFLLSYFKNRAILLLSVVGFAVAAAEAVVLTPLDRYVSLLHSVTGAVSVAPGIVLLTLFYALSPSFKPKSGTSPQQ